MAVSLYDLVRVNTATTGTGTITLGSAVAGHLTFAQASVVNGATVRYCIIDGTNTEVGTGTYNSSAGTLTRSVTASTNSGSAISLSGSAQVLLTFAAEDFLLSNLRDVSEGTPTDGQILAYAGGSSAWQPKTIAMATYNAPTVVQSAHNRVNASSITVTLGSAPAAGNLLVLIVSGGVPGSGGSVYGTPSGSGWTSITSTWHGFSQVQVWTKAVAIGDPAGYTITFPGSDPQNAYLMEVSGAAGVTATSGNSSSVPTATVNSLAFAMVTAGSASNYSSITSGYTMAQFFGNDGVNNPAALLQTSAVISATEPAPGTAPDVVWSIGTEVWLVYANIVIAGKVSTKTTDLADVTSNVAPTDGQVLKYVAASGEYVPQNLNLTTLAGGSTPSGGSQSQFYALGWNAASGVLAWSFQQLANVAVSGSYTDLLNKPTIPAAQVNSDWNASSGLAQILNKPTIPTNSSFALSGLSDVSLTTGSGVDGYCVYWNNTAGKFELKSVSGGGGGSSTLAGDSDVSISSPANGQLLMYNGTSWVNTGAAAFAGLIVPPPALASFTWANQGTAIAAQASKSIFLHDNTLSSGDQLRILYMTPPSTPYKVKALIKTWLYGASGYASVGLCFFDGSAATQRISVTSSNGAPALYVSSYTSLTAGGSVVQYSSHAMPMPDMIWLSLADDGTTVYFEYSLDGENWITAYSVAKSSGVLGPSGYSKIGVILDPATGTASGQLIGASLLSWAIVGSAP